MFRQKLAFAFCAFLGLLLFSFFSTSQGVLLPSIIEHFGLTESRQGMPSSAQSLGCMAALICSLWVIGRMPKPKLLMIAVAATALLALPMAATPGFPAFVLLYFLIGISCGFIDTLTSSSIADLFQGQTAVRMMCMLHAMFGIGGVVTPLAMNALMQRGLAWNRVYLVIGGLGLLICAYVLPMGRKWLRHAGSIKAPEQRLTLSDFLHFFKNRVRVLLLLAMALYNFYFSGVAVWTGQYFEKVFAGWTQNITVILFGKTLLDVTIDNHLLGALTLSLFWGGVLICRLVAPFLKVSPGNYMRISALASGAALAVGAASGNPVIVVIATALTSLLSGAMIPMAMHTLSEQVPENTLLATTVGFLFIYAAQSLGGVTLGAIEGRFGLTAIMLTCALAVALAGAATLGVRAKRSAEA